MYPLLQLTIDLWNTTTPNQFHILQNAHILKADVPPPSNQPYISGTPLHQISFTYGKMHICLWQMYLPPPPIGPRSLEHHYTKSISHIAKCIYT